MHFVDCVRQTRCPATPRTRVICRHSTSIPFIFFPFFFLIQIFFFYAGCSVLFVNFCFVSLMPEWNTKKKININNIEWQMNKIIYKQIAIFHWSCIGKHSPTNGRMKKKKTLVGNNFWNSREFRTQENRWKTRFVEREGGKMVGPPRPFEWMNERSGTRQMQKIDIIFNEALMRTGLNVEWNGCMLFDWTILFIFYRYVMSDAFLLCTWLKLFTSKLWLNDIWSGRRTYDLMVTSSELDSLFVDLLHFHKN